MTNTRLEFDLHTARPSVFLDRWVWIRLARAANGEPKEPGDSSILESVRDAAAGGVAFPLTSTYYIESLTTKNPRQRTDLARTIASITNCSTLRRRRDLLRHQMLHAMHVHFGRPTFRPAPPEPLGVGVFWAMLGRQAPPRVNGPDGRVDPSTLPGGPGLLRRLAQFAEVQFLAGAKDDELDDLRKRGYKPEATIAAGDSRLAWEQAYVELLADDDPISRDELRVRVQAREFIQEYLDLFNELLAEYRLSIDRLGSNTPSPRASRQRIVAFADDIPTLRLATDLKYHLFRDANKRWQTNDLYDIDAISIAAPYCHAILADAEMTNLLNRSRAGDRLGTTIIPNMGGLADMLPDLTRQAAAIPGDRTGWDWAGPGTGFSLDLPDPAPLATPDRSREPIS